jgi:glutamate---cysteine ligase / carboxylate-amine ligase
MEFRSSPTDSIGAEIELQLLDHNSLDLVDGILPLLEICGDTPHVKPEYIQFTVEIASKVCQSAAELRTHLEEQTARVDRAARTLGMRLAATGTHPFCRRLGLVTPSQRYARVEEDTGYVGYSQITYALHVHVGMRSGEEAILLMRRLRPYLAPLLALSASSPYWQRHDTGFASYRHRVLMAAHAFGAPPQLGSWREFVELVNVSQRARIFEGFGDMHWDVRPRPDFGTLEVRVMDVQPTLDENVALAALVQALIDHLRVAEDGAALAPLPLWLELENQYRASHHGLRAECVTDSAGSVRPMTQVIAELLETVRPYAHARGTEPELQILTQLVADGGNCARQRTLFHQTGTHKAVVEAMARRLAEELGWRRRAPHENPERTPRHERRAPSA